MSAKPPVTTHLLPVWAYIALYAVDALSEGIQHLATGSWWAVASLGMVAICVFELALTYRLTPKNDGRR